MREEAAKMEELVDKCIMEAVYAATGIDFEQDEGAKERLQLLTNREWVISGIRRS